MESPPFRVVQCPSLHGSVFLPSLLALFQICFHWKAAGFVSVILSFNLKHAHLSIVFHHKIKLLAAISLRHRVGLQWEAGCLISVGFLKLPLASYSITGILKIQKNVS